MPLPSAPFEKENLPLKPLSKNKDNVSNDDAAEAEILKQTRQNTSKKTGISDITYEIISEDLMNTPASFYEQFDSKVVLVIGYVQDQLQETNQSEIIAKARAHRGEFLNEAKPIVNNIAMQYIISKNLATGKNAEILSSLVVNEVCGLGPIEPLWQNPDITEIMVNGAKKVRIETGGKLHTVKGAVFRDEEHLLETCRQILANLGRTIDVAHPYEDGRLPDGSRINVTHPTIGNQHTYLTIRRFREEAYSMEDLVNFGSMTPELAQFLGTMVWNGMSTIVNGPTGSGKQVSHDTKIPTPEGMTTMGDLQVGDYVLDENGEPTKVTAKYSNKVPVAYEMTFSDGTKVVADEDHNWFTSTRQSRISSANQSASNFQRVKFATEEEKQALIDLYEKSDEYITLQEIITTVPRLKYSIYNISRDIKNKHTHGRTIKVLTNEIMPIIIARADTFIKDQRDKLVSDGIYTTKEILETLRTPTGHANHAIRVMSKPTAYSEKKLIVPPYTLGAWLGDGNKNDGTIFGIDDEIFNNVTAEGLTVKSVKYDTREGKHSNLKKVRYSGLKMKLREIGVIGNKHIPDAYLYGSVEQREALVAGLLDTEGTVNKQGIVSLTNSNKSIIEGFRQILHSLGYQTSLTSKTPTYNYKGVKKQGSISYTVNFVAKKDVFRISRKQTKHKEYMQPSQGLRNEYRFIVDVKPVASVPMSCITVDSENHLYLVTDAFITTHNTTLLNALSGCIPEFERVITIEDNIEMTFNPKKDVISLEARKAAQGEKGAVTIRDLVRNTLRMRPDRIVVGEVRDGSAYDMLQAMNTGHDGSMTTVHANDPWGTIDRIVNLISEVGEVDSNRALSLVAGGVDLIVSIERFEDGTRKISSIAEIPARVKITNGMAELEPVILWEYVQTGVDEDGKIVGGYEKRNDLSKDLIRRKRLDNKETLTLQQVYDISKHAD